MSPSGVARAPSKVSARSQERPDPCLSPTGEGAAKPRGLEAGGVGSKCPGLRGRPRPRRRVSNCFVLGCVNAAFSPGRGSGRITSPAAAGEVADVRVGG